MTNIHTTEEARAWRGHARIRVLAGAIATLATTLTVVAIHLLAAHYEAGSLLHFAAQSMT